MKILIRSERLMNGLKHCRYQSLVSPEIPGNNKVDLVFMSVACRTVVFVCEKLVPQW